MARTLTGPVLITAGLLLAGSVRTAAQATGGEVRRPSTLVERTLWGAGTGMLTLMAVQAARRNTTDPGVAGPVAYAGGAILGITLVTAAREGTRLEQVILGALAGAAASLAFAWAACRVTGDDLDTPGPCTIPSAIVSGAVFAIAVPLGGALGHAR